MVLTTALFINNQVMFYCTIHRETSCYNGHQSNMMTQVLNRCAHTHLSDGCHRVTAFAPHLSPCSSRPRGPPPSETVTDASIVFVRISPSVVHLGPLSLIYRNMLNHNPFPVGSQLQTLSLTRFHGKPQKQIIADDTSPLVPALNKHQSFQY